ncbi:MupA/Atu3671 family FMN-dependent luciferase-like monooxygenase [Aliikangiella maris]|uniref:MupA/Atu3671 family FMN-dependent luciferase-like monooxygenase n=2 Tax=Aliikangiella maris TaxID=3162458 RepID=A0ABV2BU05_9GAMM
MNQNKNQQIADIFASVESKSIFDNKQNASQSMTFSYLFFSDVRKDITDQNKYRFARELVEFADQSGFHAVYFPERHFYEFGSIYANNSIMAAYFAPLTKNIRLRTAAVTATLHHPVEIVENWAMVDILSNGRVDLGIGNGWNKADFVLSPDTYHDRVNLRNERIPMIQKLWRGESIEFAGPDGEMFSTRVFPRPIQPEINIWYVSASPQGFEYAGSMGYNIFTMLYGIDLNELEKKIKAYRKARAKAGFDPEAGIVSLMMHTFVHPDAEWVNRVVREPFKDYIRSSLAPHMKAAGKKLDQQEMEKMVDYSYARYFQTGGVFGDLSMCQKQIDHARQVGVNDIAFLQDFGIDYAAVKDSLIYLEQLVKQNQ